MATAYSRQQIIDILTAAAQKYGVPPDVLIAVAQVESGLNPTEPGDYVNGQPTSFGLFQEHQGGELTTVAKAENPEYAANLAAQTISEAMKSNPGVSWGQAAALAQRPANQTAYAQAVNSAIPNAQGQNWTPATGGPTGGKIPGTTAPENSGTGGGQQGNPTALAGVGATGNANVPVQGTAGAASATLAPPIAGANPKNFHGYDLSSIPENQLGNAEHAIENYLVKPGYAAQLNQRIIEDYGYEGSWISKIPELQGILIWAATSLDPATAAGQLAFLGALRNTKWYQQTDQNQRAWDQVQAQDPAQANNALQQAQEKVIATANQIGVNLNKNQLHQIAEMYAANSYTPTGVLGTQSGTSQEWLDQAVISAVTTIKQTGNLPNTTPGAQQLAAPGAAPTAGQPSALEAAGPQNVGGLASLLYSDFQQAAQSYLMYNPDDPKSSLMNENTIMGYVNQALGRYTGTGASGLINQFATDQTAQFTEQLKAQASKLYPSLAESIAQGVTPQQYVQPLSQMITNTLGLDQNSINFTSPQWSWAIATPDPKTGVKTALTQDQILQKITSPNFTFQGPDGKPMTFDNTNTAMQNAHSTIQSLAAMFGTGGQ